MAVLSPDDVGIILTYQCPSACAHCLYNCGPRRKGALSVETLRAALDALRVYPRPPQVHFTGGEPFLHFDLLLAGAQLAAERGIVAYLETGASWCVDDGETLARFAALRDAGLRAVLISVSPFHAERIPLARTLRAIRAAQQVFGARRALIYQEAFVELLRRFGESAPIPLDRYTEAYGPETARELLWDGFGVIPGGRAGYRLGQLARKRPAEMFVGQSCAWDLLYAPHSHFDLYGNFVPGFCGGLSVGDWRELPALLADFQAGRYPRLIEILAAQGPYGLFELAQVEAGYRPLPDGYAGKCHLCVDARRSLAARGAYPELQPLDFYTTFDV